MWDRGGTKVKNILYKQPNTISDSKYGGDVTLATLGSGQEWDVGQLGEGISLDGTDAALGLTTISPSPGFWHAPMTQFTFMSVCEIIGAGGGNMMSSGGNSNGISVGVNGAGEGSTLEFALSRGGTDTILNSAAAFLEPSTMIVVARLQLDDQLDLFVNGFKVDTGTNAGVSGTPGGTPQLFGGSGGGPALANGEWAGIANFCAYTNFALTDSIIYF